MTITILDEDFLCKHDGSADFDVEIRQPEPTLALIVARCAACQQEYQYPLDFTVTEVHMHAAPRWHGRRVGSASLYVNRVPA